MHAVGCAPQLAAGAVELEFPLRFQQQTLSGVLDVSHKMNIPLAARHAS
jgi:hypothetical protein